MKLTEQKETADSFELLRSI